MRECLKPAPSSFWVWASSGFVNVSCSLISRSCFFRRVQYDAALINPPCILLNKGLSKVPTSHTMKGYNEKHVDTIICAHSHMCFAHVSGQQHVLPHLIILILGQYNSTQHVHPRNST